jgi:hypothetical protein
MTAPHQSMLGFADLAAARERKPSIADYFAKAGIRASQKP